MIGKRRMEGKRVLVTGSGTGIGTGVALEFAREGAAVALHYSRSGEGAHAAVEEIRKAGGKAEAFQADFRSVEQAEELPKKAATFLDGLDVLEGIWKSTRHAQVVFCFHNRALGVWSACGA